MDLNRIEQMLINLQEAVVSNSNNTQLRLNSLEKLVSDTQLKQEKKMQEMQDVVSSLSGQMNQQLNKTHGHQELKRKAESLMEEIKLKVKATDTKMKELQDLLSNSCEKSNQQSNHKETEQKKVMAKRIKAKGVEMLNETSSVSQLLDKFLFGSEEEQLAFESLCIKWTIKHIDSLMPEEDEDYFMPEEDEKELIGDTFSIFENQLEAQLRLTINSSGFINFHFKNIKRKGHTVAIKNIPMVTCIIKDLSGRNKHLITYKNCSLYELYHCSEFGFWNQLIDKLDCDRLISPRDKSMEVLFLVEQPKSINKPLSIDGTMTDTIRHFSRKLQMEKEGLMCGHLGPSFLTHVGGFRVSFRLQLNARCFYGNKRGIEAEIDFFSHDFVFLFASLFAHETSVTLINQRDANKNITVKQQANEAKYYRMAITSVDELYSEGFMLNDSLPYHVTIKPIEYGTNYKYFTSCAVSTNKK